MEIKELHLRNIASIESADIDFGKDLTDPVTGEPAPIFLISGDTGAGKSVILDGISMALFGTTPRIESVPDQRNNKFRDENGEESNIFAIEQYTRIGISEKEDCYSEVVFTGNDGREYRSRLTLGMFLGNTDKGTGRRPLKRRKAQLRVSVGGEEYSGKDAGQVINKAIGLSFEQFSRMAMLAQGQFAAFLTGRKEDRETILEQLTNTSHFSDYGKAIGNLYTAAKTRLKQADTAYDTERQHTLPEEELNELRDSMEATEKEKEENDRKIKTNEGRLAAVRALEGAEAERKEKTAEAERLRGIIDGEEYKKAKSLVTDWDATADQRQLLRALRKNRSDMEGYIKALPGMKERYQALSADCAFRTDKLGDRKKALDSEKKWQSDHASQDSLYRNAEAAVKDLERYETLAAKIKETDERLGAEKGKTAALQKDLAEKAETCRMAEEACSARQKEIDGKTEERKKLEPEKTNKELDDILRRRTGLSLLIGNLQDIEEKEKQRGKLAEEIGEDEKRSAELLKRKTADKDAYDAAEKTYRLADRCYSTMRSSVDDVLVNLRHRLVEEKEEVCPLCGQRIESIRDDFSGQLTQLEKNQKEAEAARDAAKKRYEGSSEEWNTFSGLLEARKAGLSSQDESLGKLRDETGKKAVELGLDAGGNLADQAEALGRSLSGQEDELRKRQQAAIDIQRQIDSLLQGKSSLDVEAGKAKGEKESAQKALDDNGREIVTLTKQAGELETEKKGVRDAVSASLGKDYPDWESDIQATVSRLRGDSEKYLVRVKNIETEESVIRSEEKTLEIVKGFDAAILRDFPDWACRVTPCERPTGDLIGDWRGMGAEADKLKGDIGRCGKEIEECAAGLDSWYAGTGRNEKALEEIAASEPRLEESRAQVKRTDELFRSAADAAAAAARKKEEALEALGVEKEEDAPPVETLEEEKDSLSRANDGLVARLGSIGEKLKADSENVGRFRKAEAEKKAAETLHARWKLLYGHFGGTRFRTLVQTYILRPLLNNANIYLSRITERYRLTCSEENEQLSIFVEDTYLKQVRTATVLSGGERFMISLALSLALSSLNRPDLNVNILFIDEGFGTLDKESLGAVMYTLDKLQEIAGESNRRVGIISHREELDEVPVQIHVKKKGEGRSGVEIIKK